MGGFEGARCVGLSRLFDSLDQADHAEAKRRCEGCPATDACAAEAARIAAALPNGRCYSNGLVGTWAGQLYGARNTKPREHGTDRGYGQHRHRGEAACESCLVAHAAREAGRKASAA